VKFVLAAALLVMAAAVPATGQAPTSTSTAPSRTPSSLQTSPFLGGVPTGTATAQPIMITVVDAINRALEHNLGLLNAQEGVAMAQGSRWTALSDLLPNASARVSETRQKVNLAAFGFPLPAGVPSVVGPFNLFDVRASVSQSVFDAKALNEARAETHNVAAAQYNVRSARDLVVLVAGNLYLQTLAAGARVQSAQAQLQTAQAIFEQATHLKEAGIVPGIDVLRAEVQLGSERQRSTAATNELEKSKLQLARVMGLPAGQAFTLSEELPYLPAPDMTVEQALDQAYKTRPDYMAAQERGLRHDRPDRWRRAWDLLAVGECDRSDLQRWPIARSSAASRRGPPDAALGAR
jgi:outer membrane protein TolC